MEEKIQPTIDQLLLDLSNPRIGEVETQPEALRAMIEFDSQHFKTMMESIKDHGLDPGDAFYVIASDTESDEYIVVDGNRRLAALMVLRQPTLLQGIPIAESLRQRLAKVAEGFDAPTIESVDAVLFEHRADADEWILRRHGRGMAGEARIFWGTLEIQRFQRDRSVLDVIEFIKKNSTFSEDRWSQIEQTLSEKASVLRRFLESRPIRELLGLGKTQENEETIPEFGAKPEVAIEVLSSIVGDIADGTANTRTYNKTEDFEEFVQQLPERLKKSGVGKPKRFRDAKVTGPGERPRQKSVAKTVPADVKRSKVKPPRNTLAPRTHRFAQPSSEKGQRLVFEASRIGLRDTPLACAYLLRAFLEHTIDGYLDANGISDWNTSKKMRHDLKSRAELVMDDLVARGSAKKGDLRSVSRTLSNPQDPVSIQALNDYHHGKYNLPSADTLRAAWDTAEPLFIAIYGAAK